jgi:hypothetical protein
MYTRAYLAGGPTYMYSTEVQDDHTGRLGKPFVSSNSGWAIQPEHGKALPETRMIAFSLLIFPHTKKEGKGKKRKKKKEGSPFTRRSGGTREGRLGGFVSSTTCSS